MKKEKKIIAKKPSAPKVPVSKKISYIGIGVFLAVGLIGLFFNYQLSNFTLLSDAPTTITLPTPSPLPLPPQPDVLKTPAPTVQPEQTSPPQNEPSAEPVFRHSEPMTIILPTEGEISANFSMTKLHYSKTMGDWRTHNGIDINADSVAEVKAAADGVVEQAYLDPLMGHTIVITHQDDYRTVYQNLASTEMVSTGQTIHQGQVIAAVGNSAPAELLEESHLHFSLKQGDSFLNPIEFVATTE